MLSKEEAETEMNAVADKVVAVLLPYAHSGPESIAHATFGAVLAISSLLVAGRLLRSSAASELAIEIVQLLIVRAPYYAQAEAPQC